MFIYYVIDVMIMSVLYSLQVIMFSVCSHLWKPQYARFWVITFIVIIGSLACKYIACTASVYDTYYLGHWSTEKNMKFNSWSFSLIFVNLSLACIYQSSCVTVLDPRQSNLTKLGAKLSHSESWFAIVTSKSAMKL